MVRCSCPAPMTGSRSTSVRAFGAGLEVVSAGDSAFALRGLSGAQASVQVSVVSPTRIRFEAAAFSVAVLALPTSVVLAAGSDTLTATVSAVDGTFRIDTDDALALVVTLEDSTGQELAFLQGESVALEFLGDGTVATLVPEGDSLTLRGRLPGTDSVQVRLNAGERELVAFAPVPIEVEEAPCSGPTADGICLQKMASGFRTPAHLTSPPGDDRLMVVRTVGVIEIIYLDGSTGRFLDMVDLVKHDDEQGLLGLAFHPDYAANGTFFVSYTSLDGNTQGRPHDSERRP